MRRSGAHPVVVVGAGPAGSAAALRLRSHGLDVVVAEALRFDRPRIGESVPPDIGVLLERLGILDGFLAEDHERCLGSASAWGTGALGYNDFVTNPYGAGWHLDRVRFDAFLAGRAQAHGATLRTSWRCHDIVARPPGGYDVTFRTAAGPRRVAASAVVDATGAQASVARRLGGRRRVTDRLIAVAARLERPGSRLGKLTMLEAVEYGWWYAARLRGNTALVMVATDPATYRRRALRWPRPWRRHLAGTEHLAFLAGLAIDGEGLATHPIVSLRLDPPSGPGWVAAGDAAAVFDPLTSQGIYKALATGIDAADAIAAYLAGHGHALARYAEATHAAYDDYLALREHLYGAEARWAQHPFWRGRRPLEPAAAGRRPL